MLKLMINRLTKSITHRPVFYFWEPAGAMHPYIHLCMKTWKHLHRVDVIGLDYSNLSKFTREALPEEMMAYSLPQQADLIRLAVLSNNGGVWLDTDAIVLRNPVVAWKALQESDMVVFGFPGRSAANNFIATSGPRVPFIDSALDETLQRVRQTKPASVGWDYIGNAYYRRAGKTEGVKVLDILSNGYIAEAVHGAGFGMENYRKFWFDTDRAFSTDLLTGNCGLVALHNSWTPADYKRKSEADVLAGKDMLAKYIRHALK